VLPHIPPVDIINTWRILQSPRPLLHGISAFPSLVGGELLNTRRGDDLEVLCNEKNPVSSPNPHLVNGSRSHSVLWQGVTYSP